MEKEKTLSEKRQDTNRATPRFKRYVYAEEDVKQFIKEVLDEIKWIKNKSGYYVFDEDTEWLYREIRKIITKKAGKELE